MAQNRNYFANYYDSVNSGFNNNNNLNNYHDNNQPGPSGFSNNYNSSAPNNNLNNNDYSSAPSIEPINELRSVNEVLPRYRSVFASYPCFNIIQSRVIDVVLYSDESVVVSAPTGSGKTAIFELAIVRFLTCLESYNQEIPYKIVYVAPMKSLCEERVADWHKKFANLGLSCLAVTGDSDTNINFQTILNHNLIITTPEKWDSLTRRWRDNKSLASLVKLFMIDEVHLLGEDNRGPTLEAIVCRMKTIQSNDNQKPSMKMRFVAVSASIPNAEDIAEWLKLPATPAKSFMFGDEMRPVKLKKVVLGFPYSSEKSTPFKFDIMLSYKLQSIMLQYAEGKPTLIFCSTRKSVEMTSKHLIQNLTITLNAEQKQTLLIATSTISDGKIREVLANGVCYHHAGLAIDDRRIIEDLFRNANLPILVTTSTLAMGVNLPAHLVVIKSTKYYSNGEYQDYSESMLLQMIGRAGRPQFDTSATAVILTTDNDKHKFENLVGGEQIVESNLHRHLTEHLNAEVVLNTITDLGVAMQWLTSTFLYIRARKHPRYYGLPSGLSLDQIDKKLLNMCQIELNKLARVGMLTIDHHDVGISPTSTGSLMAKYCIAFDTMKLFTEVTGKEILQQILTLISKCREFSDIYLRVNDKKALNVLNKCRNRDTIRFPYNDRIKTVDMKINCIIQAVFGCLPIVDQSLVTESQKIMRIGERISKCLAEYLETKGNCYPALLNALLLAKCFHTRLWENSPFVSKQLSGIGSAFSSALVTAGKTSFKDLMDANPRDIERIINRKAPMGNTIQDQVAHLPDYELTLEEVGNKEWLTVNLKITLKNYELLQANSTVNVYNFMRLLVGDSDGSMWLYEKFTHKQLIDNQQISKKLEFPLSFEYEIKAHFISEDWVGFDCNVNLVPLSLMKKRESDANVKSSTKNKVQVEKGTKAGSSKKASSHIQTFMDTYFKNAKAQKLKRVPSARLLSGPKQADGCSKENDANATNISNTPRSVGQYQDFDTVEENLANSSKQIDAPLKWTHPEPIIPQQSEERHLNPQNSEQNTNNEIKSQMQSFVDDCQQAYTKENEKKLSQLPKLSKLDMARRYSIPEYLTRQMGSSNTASVQLNNHSAVARHNLDWTPRRKQRRLKQNISSAEKFEASLYESEEPIKVKESLKLPHIHLPKKQYNSENLVASHIKNEPESNASTDSDHRRSSAETNQYIIEFYEPSNSKSSDNFQKTLTWRSPLVISPAVRYSPNLSQHGQNVKDVKKGNASFSSLNSADNATLSLGTKPQLKFSISVNTESSETSLSDVSGQRPTLKQKGPTLPLSDQAYSFSQGQNLNPYENIRENSFISTSFLGSLGLIQPDANEISQSHGDSGLGTVTTQTEIKNSQPKRAGKINTTEADYYSKTLFHAEKNKKIIKQKEPEKEINHSDLNIHIQHPDASFQSKSDYPQRATQSIGTTMQDDALSDLDPNVSFAFPMFSPGPKQPVTPDKLLDVSSMSILNPNILDFTLDENMFPSQKLRQRVVRTPSQPNFTVPYDDQPPSVFDFSVPQTGSTNRLARVLSGSFQQEPSHKRLGRYPSSTAIRTNEYYRPSHPRGDDFFQQTSNPKQHEFKFQTQRPWHSQQPIPPHHMYEYRQANEPRFHERSFAPYHYPMEPLIEPNYFEQVQAGPSSSRGYWDRLSNPAPYSRSSDYDRYKTLKRQKLQTRFEVPSLSRSRSFHERNGFGTYNPNYYSQHENVSTMHPRRCNTYFDEYGMNYVPKYNHDNEEFMRRRFLNCVDRNHASSYVNPFENRSPRGFGQENLDFTISPDDIDDPDEDGEFPSN